MSGDQLASPFEAPTFTRIPNYIIDVVMPGLSAGGWKLLSVILRATLGFQDGETGERLTEDMLSYSQLLARSGFRHPRSIRRALTELLQQGIIRRRPSEAKRAGLLAAPFVYALNEQWLVPANELKTAPPRPGVSAAQSAVHDQTAALNASVTAADSALVTAADSALVTAALSEETKAKRNVIQEKDQRNGSLSSQISQNWSAILQELQSQTTAATFSTYLKGLTPLPGKNGELILQAGHGYDAPWIAWRLHRVVLRALRVVDPSLEIGKVLIAAPDGALFPLGCPVTGADNSEPQDGERAAPGRATERAVNGNPMETVG